MYDSFDSLPDDVQQRIQTSIAPPDPASWVRSPIEDLDGRSFLDAINAEGGEQIVSEYFDRVEAFERRDEPAEPEDLGKIFHFDAADLDANRAGLLSTAQRARVVRGDVLKVLGAAACVVAGVVFNVALLTGRITAHGKGAALGVTLILIGLILAVWSWETWLDLATGSVLVADGYLRSTERTVSGRYGPRTIYCFQVGNQSFDVPRTAYDTVREGNRRLYYLRHTRTVLSIDSIQG